MNALSDRCPSRKQWGTVKYRYVDDLEERERERERKGGGGGRRRRKRKGRYSVTSRVRKRLTDTVCLCSLTNL